MHELADSDRCRITISADPNRDKALVRQQCPSRNRRHSPMHTIEAGRPAHEVRRAFRRTPDTGEFRYPGRIDAHFKHRVDNSLRDRIVPATCAQSRLSTLVFDYRKADVVRLWRPG